MLHKIRIRYTAGSGMSWRHIADYAHGPWCIRLDLIVVGTFSVVTNAPLAYRPSLIALVIVNAVAMQFCVGKQTLTRFNLQA